MRPIFFLPILLMSLLWFAACTPVLPDSPPPTATEADPGISDQLNRLATQTHVAESTLTVEALIEEPVDHPPQPEQSPSSPPPDITPPEETNPFRQFSLAEALIAGKVLGLQAVEDGLLLLSDSGYSKYQEDGWMGYFTEEMGSLVGVDTSERAWVASHDGTQIARWDEPQWSIYSSSRGWSPISAQTGNPVNPGLFSDPRGHIWLSTEQDVRAFDGNRWRVYNSDALSMTLPVDDTRSTFSILPTPNSGEVFVGRCDWNTMGPVGGGGVRRFDGQAWHEVASPINRGCATAIVADNDMNLWLGLDANLYRHKPSTGELDQVSLPEPPPETHFGYFTALTLAPDGSLWAQISLCNGGACYGGEALYRLKDGTWQQIGEHSQSVGQKLLFDAEGTPWLFSAGNVFQIIDSIPHLVEGLVVMAATTDESGNIWLIAQSTGPPTLWTTK